MDYPVQKQSPNGIPPKMSCKRDVSVVAFANLAKKNKYTPLLIESSQKLIKREERFAKTAVGWILREISKTDEKIVLDLY